MWLYAEIPSIGDIPRHYARCLPQKTALKDGAGTVSFAELDERSNRIANGIIAAGVGPRSHIGFLGKNSARYFEILFGACKAGCALTPLNWRLAAPELSAVIEDAQLPLLFADKEFCGLARAVLEQCPQKFRIVEVDPAAPGESEYGVWLQQSPVSDPKVAIDPRQTAILIYTSGTTGKPKGVQMSHQSLAHMRLCEHLEPALQWQPDDVMLMVMPNFHLVGTGLSLQALYNGSTLSILPTLDPGQLLNVIARDRPTICALVPTAIQMLIDHPAAASTDFSSLRLVMYAGSPISSMLLQRALQQMRCRFMQFYGATETCGAVTLLRPEQHVIDDEQRLKSCGTPLPLIDIRLTDAEGKEVAPGEIGELWIRSPALATGYWNQPETTAAAFQEGWYRTGDAGRRDENGLYYLVDRVKDMIVTGGENVYSTEVEQALQKHPGVRMSAVIGVPDEKWGEKVVAVVIPAPDTRPSPEELIAHCRALIAGYKVPKAIEFVETLPMTATGKVLKRAVRDRYLAEAKAARAAA